MPQLRRLTEISRGLLFGSGRAAVGALNAVVPKDYDLLGGRAYGPQPRHRLDVYLPRGARQPMPVVVFIYGGNWQGGSKGLYPFIGEALTSRGYIAVIPDYRVHPEVRYPAFLEDNAMALAWVMDHAAQWGGDASRVHLMGHSAGAFNAALLAFDDRWLGDRRAAIRSLVGLAGPYDVLHPDDRDLQDIFAAEPDPRRYQPISYAHGDVPPTFLAHGTDDLLVGAGNSERLAARIRAYGGHVEERYYERGHIAIVAAMASPLRYLAPVLDDVSAFLRANDRPNLRG